MIIEYYASVYSEEPSSFLALIANLSSKVVPDRKLEHPIAINVHKIACSVQIIMTSVLSLCSKCDILTLPA